MITQPPASKSTVRATHRRAKGARVFKGLVKRIPVERAGEYVAMKAAEFRAHAAKRRAS